MNHKTILIIAISFFGVNASLGQYNIGLFTECNQDPLVIFNCPESNNFINQEVILRESISRVIFCHFDTAETKEGKRRLSIYTETEFNNDGLVLSHFYLDSMWVKKCINKEKWKLNIANTNYFYSQNNQLDSTYRVYLDNYPGKRQGTFIWEVSCRNTVHVLDTVMEIPNKDFHKIAATYKPNSEYDLDFKQALRISQNDTLKSHELILLNDYYHFVDKNGLIRSVWKMKNKKLELYSIFIYEKSNATRPKLH
jgi:hypothetical protein